MIGWCAEDQVEKYDVLPSQLRWDSKGMALGTEYSEHCICPIPINCVTYLYVYSIPSR
jgi:hypothetical protein